MDISHLGEYVRIGYEKNLKRLKEDIKDEELAKKIAKKETLQEVKDGVQTLQYQINTLQTSNGQAPFLTMFMHIKDNDKYKEELAMIIEEILKQRIKGIKNEQGVYITPAFPKLIYVLDENNVDEDSEFYYLTKLAIECTAKRMYPDYISAKKMRKNYEGNVFSAMGCRSFLSPWKNEQGEYQFEGRFNSGVVSLNLPQIGILSGGDEDKFWRLLDNRLDLAKEVLLFRHELLRGMLTDTSPIHWQFGALARLKKGETIDKLLYGGYSTISLGYIGIYELTKLVKGVSHTDVEGLGFAIKVLQHMKTQVDKWKAETNIGFALYSTPSEGMCYRLAKIDKERFGEIKDVTDKGYYTNSYHVDVREEINAFDKLKFESDFQDIATGGCISYVEIPNMNHNLKALETMVRFIYDNITYAEFNTKSDYCHVCGFDGEIKVNEDNDWECPNCNNKDTTRMNVVRRVCG